LKNVLKIVLTLSIVLALGCTVAIAADQPAVNGVYDVSVEDAYSATVSVVPQDESGQDVTGATATINDSTVTFYPGAVKFKVTYANAAAGTYYLNLTLNDGSTVPTENNIVYIDQNGTAEFTVYPSSLESGKTYSICLSSSGSDFPTLTKVASFKAYLAYMLGDVDANGKVETRDALLTLRNAAELETFTDIQKLAADVDKNGRVETRDALQILRFAAEIIDSFE